MNLAAFGIEDDDVFFDANFVRDGNYYLSFSEEQTKLMQIKIQSLWGGDILTIKAVDSKYSNNCQSCQNEKSSVHIGSYEFCVSCTEFVAQSIIACVKAAKTTLPKGND